MSPFNSNEVEELLLESVVLVCIVNVHSHQLWGVHVQTPGEGGRKSNISEHHCSTNRWKNDAVHLETKQQSFCAKDKKCLQKTKQWCQTKTKAAFIGLWRWTAEDLIVCRALGNSCVAWWRRGAEILHCQSIPWARIRFFFFWQSTIICRHLAWVVRECRCFQRLTEKQTERAIK